MRGNALADININISVDDTLFFVDKKLGLELGTTFKIIKCHACPDELNKKLSEHMVPIQFSHFGVLPKEYRQVWRKFVEPLGVAKEYWMDNNLLTEDRIIENL